MSFTPGPWKAVPLASGITIQTDPVDLRRSGIAEVRLWPGNEIAKGNARLIAAAPDLLEACKAGRQKLVTYVSVYSGDKELRKLLDMWDAAIARAEGRT